MTSDHSSTAARISRKECICVKQTFEKVLETDSGLTGFVQTCG